MSNKYDWQCPQCDRKFKVPVGKEIEICPDCKKKSVLGVEAGFVERDFSDLDIPDKDEPEIPEIALMPEEPKLNVYATDADDYGTGEYAKYSFFTLIGIAALLLVLLFRTLAPNWEYKVVNPRDHSFEEKMNDLGDEGWEIAYARRASGDYSFGYEVILKRRK